MLQYFLSITLWKYSIFYEFVIVWNTIFQLPSRGRKDWDRKSNRAEKWIISPLSSVTHPFQRGDEEHGQGDKMQHGEEDQQEDHGCLQCREASGVLSEPCVELHWRNKRPSPKRRALSSRQSRSAAHTSQTTSTSQQCALRASPVSEDDIRASALCNPSELEKKTSTKLANALNTIWTWKQTTMIEVLDSSTQDWTLEDLSNFPSYMPAWVQNEEHRQFLMRSWNCERRSRMSHWCIYIRFGKRET